MLQLLIATTNPGKIREIADLFADQRGFIKLLSLSDFNISSTAAETGCSLRDNAVEKSLFYSGLAGKGIYVAAEDSGLEIEALNGEPGIYSSRYAGDGAADSDNIQKVLDRMQGVGNRRARFRAVVALSLDQETLLTFEGTVEGDILDAPRGSFGFGYDPIFFHPSTGKSFAEIRSVEKNRISHRYNAFKQLKSYILGQLL